MADVQVDSSSLQIKIENLETYSNLDRVGLQSGSNTDICWYVAEAVKDNAYSERNKVLVLACRMARALGHEVGRWHHEGEEPGWGWIVSILLPTGWVDWHIPDSEIDWFADLPILEDREYLNYCTQDKYSRILNYGLDGLS